MSFLSIEDQWHVVCDGCGAWTSTNYETLTEADLCCMAWGWDSDAEEDVTLQSQHLCPGCQTTAGGA